MSFEPTASTSISAQVNTIVRVELEEAVLPEDQLVGAEVHGRPPVPAAAVRVARVSRVTTGRAMTNPSRQASSRCQWPRETR